MNEGCEDAATRLNDLLEARFKPDAQVRLCSLWWSLRDAPTVGLGIARDAAEKMKQGQHMDDDPVRDTVLTMRLMWDCDERSHFALESTIRYLHASGDLLAQVVNDALGLTLSEGECSLPKVLEAVSAESRWSGLSGALHGFQTSPNYRYVADATNRVKHRNAHKSSIWARIDDSDDVEVRQSLAAFEHEARSHDETDAAEVETCAEALQNFAGDVLDELRAVLVASAATEQSGG